MISDDPTDEALVALAYAMAVGPDRLYELQEGLSARFKEAIAREAGPGDDIVADAFGPLESHFGHALDLLHQGSRQRKPAWNAIQLMEQDHRALARIRQDGVVQYANDAAGLEFGLKASHAISAEVFEDRTVAPLHDALARLGTVEDNRILGIFKMIDVSNGSPRQFGLKQVRDDNGAAVGYLFEMSANWDPVLAQKFKDLMKLTGAKGEILRAVVTGMTLSDLADSRDRKVSTVRLQAKRLLAKLHLRSQTELACLYAAFTENEARGTRSPAWDSGSRQPLQSFATSGGRHLTYEITGPLNGKPVLFFSGAFGRHDAYTIHVPRAFYAERPAHHGLAAWHGRVLPT